MVTGMNLILLGLAFVSMAFAETVSDIGVCTEEGLSVGSNVDTYLCKEEPSFSLSDPAAVASSRTKEQVVIDENEFSFLLETFLTFSDVTTCPEEVTSTMYCERFKLYIGTSADATDGSPVTVGGEGFSGMAAWNCYGDDYDPKVVYYFPIAFVDGDATSSGDIKASVDVIKAVIAETGTDGIEAIGTNFKPSVFQKFAAVTNKTTTYYIKIDDETFHKFFVSADTTITLTKGDYTEAFGQSVTTGPETMGECANAVQIVYSGSAKSNVSVMMILTPFLLTMLKISMNEHA